MTGGDRSVPPPLPGGEDLRLSQDLAQDWMTVWQSELSSLAVDREVREAWHLVASLWADAKSAGFAALAQAAPREAAGGDVGAAGPVDAPRAPSAAPAPDPRDAEVERLHDRVAELEQRLARLERRRR